MPRVASRWSGTWHKVVPHISSIQLRKSGALVTEHPRALRSCVGSSGLLCVRFTDNVQVAVQNWCPGRVKQKRMVVQMEEFKVAFWSAVWCNVWRLAVVRSSTRNVL
ncbi:hypothetical protein TcWFU_006489 [Taenia crassiceps]|uniref:Uncharacterized protein n=1 Tax=Taenia crassiceps TaxID=6207 RepID=A0ABR4Q2P4_9CEST